MHNNAVQRYCCGDEYRNVPTLRTRKLRVYRSLWSHGEPVVRRPHLDAVFHSVKTRRARQLPQALTQASELLCFLQHVVKRFLIDQF
jgi:hypothetical protein